MRRRRRHRWVIRVKSTCAVLGANQTLILIDGRRSAGANLSGSPQQPDLNGIPLAAIERIEVLPTTASGIYGGGATGGVINVVLRRDYSGLESRVSYENSFDSGAIKRRVDLATGFNLEGGKTTVLLAGNYSNANALAVGDRDLVQRGRNRILENNGFGGFDTLGIIPPLGATTNIRSQTGANLTLKSGGALNSPITFVPIGYAGAGSDAGAGLVAMPVDTISSFPRRRKPRARSRDC